MAVTVIARGTGSHNSSATTFTLSPSGSLAAGSMAVLVFSADNAAANGDAFTTFKVTDDKANLWTRRVTPLYDPGAANAGVTGAQFTTDMSGGVLTSSSVITVTFDTATTAKVWAMWEVVPDTGKVVTYVASGVNTGAATGTPTVTTPSITSGDVVIGAGHAEDTDSWTGDADASSGSWSTHQHTGVGAGAAAISVTSQAKVVTGTATQTYNPTRTSSDCILSWMQLRQIAFLTVGATDQSAYVLLDSLNLKFNTFDFALKDPAVIPATGDVVTLGGPPGWTGNVASVQTTDLRLDYVLVTITATNTDLAFASAAPFGLSDAPNNVTTFGFQNMSVRTAVNLDATLETTGSCTIFKPGLWPAMTFTITSANRGFVAQSFTVTDVNVTWPLRSAPIYRITFGDPIVTMSVWVASQTALPGPGTITQTMITDGAVITPKLAANAVTADKLEATLLLASLIKTAIAGSRVELDTAGFRAYSATDDLLVNIPTDGSPVYVNAQVQALSLDVTGTAIFRGTANEFAANSITQFDGYQSNPAQAPTLAAGWPSTITFANATPLGAIPRGGYYDANGGADGATACYVALGEVGGVRYVFEWKISTGALDRVTAISSGVGLHNGWITRIAGGDAWYVCDSTGPAGGFAMYLTQIVRSTGVASATVPVSSYFTADSYDQGQPIKTDGTFLYIIGAGSTATTDRVVKFNTALVWQSTLELAQPTPLSGYTTTRNDGLFEIQGSSFWASALHQKSGSPSLVRIHQYSTTTGLEVANSDFPVPIASATGFFHDGTTFWTLAATTGAGGYRPFGYTHTLWDWTTASPIYWVAYTWYDSAGTTHETQIGPRASITMGRRQQLVVTCAPVPTGGADDPNNHRVYMVPNATDPGATASHLQSTFAGASATYTTYTAGAADPGANGFSSIAVPGIVKSQASTGWQLSGDGGVILGSVKTRMGGTSFPVSPTTDTEIFYRQDKRAFYQYDGSRWNLIPAVTEIVPITDTGQALPFAATGNYGRWGQGAGIHSDVNLVDMEVTFQVAGGTALSGSHKWVLTCNYQSGGALIGTFNINSGASDVWRRGTATIGALMGSNDDLDFTLTKTGTPGTLYIHVRLKYHWVDT